jgi:hypothetical protein
MNVPTCSGEGKPLPGLRHYRAVVEGYAIRRHDRPFGLLQVRVYDEVSRPEELDGPWPAGEGLLTVIRLERCGQPVIPGPDEDLLDLDPDPDRPLVGRRVLLERKPCNYAGETINVWSLCECSMQDDMHRWDLYMRRVRRRQEEDGRRKN